MWSWRTTPTALRSAVLTGRIVKATAGFYYVQCGDVRYACRARGIFRKDNTAPLVGDLVEVLPGEENTGTVQAVLPRKNEMVRPPLANLDRMAVMLSVVDPPPNLVVVDKLLALLEKKGIDPVIVVSKCDIADAGDLAALYTKAGFAVYVVSSETGEGVSALVDALAGKVTAFSGNSGVGKSSLLNAIDPRFAIEVGDTSKKLGRGRHTTRHVELFSLENGALVADTPGFSSIDLGEMGGIGKDELADCFRDFAPYLGGCRFVNCAHRKEKGCAVLEAVEAGGIDPRRHDSYMQLYDEVKDIKPWESR